MELDDLKSAWKDLDRRLGEQHAIGVRMLRERRLDRLRRGLRPLAWGQSFQILVGIAGSLFFAAFWITHLHQPALLASGLVMHLYCIGLIVLGAVMVTQIARIDYAAPVVAIQHRLLRLRRTYALYGAVLLGLPWWFLYVPLVIVLAGMGSGADLARNAPAFICIGLAGGAAGLAASLGFHRWAHRPGGERLGRAVDDGMAGGSIRRAQRMIDELLRFERE